MQINTGMPDMLLMLHCTCMKHIIQCCFMFSGRNKLWNFDVQDKYKLMLERLLPTPKHAIHNVLQHTTVFLVAIEITFVFVPDNWLWMLPFEGCQAWAINQILVVLEHHNYACTQVIQHVSAIATSFRTELIYVDTQWSNLPVPIVLDVMSVNELLVNVCPVHLHDSGDIFWVGLSTNPWPHNIICTSGQPTFVRDLKKIMDIFL